jgi:Lariat debranching enzyme, C-terminal domain
MSSQTQLLGGLFLKADDDIVPYFSLHFKVIEIPLPSAQNSKSPPELTYDPEWLAICRALHPYLTTERSQRRLPKPEEARNLIATELKWVRENLPGGGLRAITDVQTFIPTAPGPNQTNTNQRREFDLQSIICLSDCHGVLVILIKLVFW